jgi:hypothetical protein
LEKAGLDQQEGQMKEKPKILPLPNGPYYLLNSTQSKIVENLQNPHKPFSTIKGDKGLGKCYMLLLPWLRPDRKSLEEILPNVDVPSLSILKRAEKRKGNQGEIKTNG